VPGERSRNGAAELPGGGFRCAEFGGGLLSSEGGIESAEGAGSQFGKTLKAKKIRSKRGAEGVVRIGKEPHTRGGMYSWEQTGPEKGAHEA